VCLSPFGELRLHLLAEQASWRAAKRSMGKFIWIKAGLVPRRQAARCATARLRES